jgi:uncharacterized OB-fold protein
VRLLPDIDDASAPYWEAAARGHLVLARCSRCERFAHPPDLVCPNCGHTDPRFRFDRVSGRGAIRSWTVLRQTFLPGFEDDLPFVLVDVELDDQADLRLIGRLVDAVDAPLALGDRVTLAFEQLSDEVAVPAFALEADR